MICLFGTAGMTERDGAHMYNHQLDTFIQVADSGSFSKAAQALYITPTAVIKQMNLLEARLGLTLFDRTHRGLTLTKAGKSIYAAAQHIIRYSNDAVAQARELQQGQSNVIRLGTSIMTPSKPVLDLWPAIQRRCPELGIRLASFENTPENARSILRSLGEVVDVVAGPFDDPFLRERKCAALELSLEPIMIAMPFGHPLAAKETLTYDDLCGQTVMMIQRGWNTYIDRTRDDLWEHCPDTVIEDFPFFDVDVFNHCANDGLTIIAIERWFGVHPLLTARPVAWDHVVPFGIMHARRPAPHVQAFLNAVCDELGLDSATAEHRP